MDDALDQAALMIALLIGIGILILLSVVVAIAYYILLWMIWQRYHHQAAEAFDEVLLEHGNYRAEDVAYNLFGTRPGAGGSHHTAEILFGVEVNRR